MGAPVRDGALDAVSALRADTCPPEYTRPSIVWPALTVLAGAAVVVGLGMRRSSRRIRALGVSVLVVLAVACVLVAAWTPYRP